MPVGSVSSGVNTTQVGVPVPRKTIRLWPGVAAVVLQLLIRFGVPIVMPGAAMYGFLGSLVCALAVIVWWAFFSRVPWRERWGVVVLTILVWVATARIVDKSIAGGMMGFMYPVYAIQTISVALVAGALFSQRLSAWPRRALMAAAVLLGCGGWALMRTEGIHGMGSDLAWRWSKTPEQRLLAQAGGSASTLPEVLPAALPPSSPTAQPAAPVAAKIPADRPAAPHTEGEPPVLPPTAVAAKTVADWPGFRGPDRDEHHPRRTDQDRLVRFAAGRAMAPADRTGLVLLRGPRRPHLHPGAAR